MANTTWHPLPAYTCTQSCTDIILCTKQRFIGFPPSSVQKKILWVKEQLENIMKKKEIFWLNWKLLSRGTIQCDENIETGHTCTRSSALQDYFSRKVIGRFKNLFISLGKYYGSLTSLLLWKQTTKGGIERIAEMALIPNSVKGWHFFLPCYGE